MSREIEFRAWDKKNKIMIPDVPNKSPILEFVNAGTKNQDSIIVGYEINPDLILMQYTGLKDKNGKKIYEGDIVAIECIRYAGVAQYDSRLKEYYRKIDDYICKYDSGRFVFSDGLYSLRISDFWCWNRDGEFNYATGDVVRKSDCFGHYSKDIFRFIELKGNIYENFELLNGGNNV